MSETLSLVHARELFFNQGTVPEGWVAPHITRSWERSRNIKLNGAGLTPIVAPLLGERRESSRLLLDSAQPELDALAEHAIGNGCVVIVTDASGVILEEIGSPDFLSKAQRFALLPGVEWSEGQCGTNAIGTVIVEREPLAVLGGEHYLAENGALGCAASPIFTGRGEIAGVLDVSGDAIRVDSHTLSMVRMASQQIEHRMLLSSTRGHIVRFHANGSVLGSAREGIVAIADGHVIATNRIALGLLGERWDTMLDESVERILGRSWSKLGRHASEVILPDGQRVMASLERNETRVASRFVSGIATSRNGNSGATSRLSISRAHDANAESLSHAHAVERHPELGKALRVLDAGIPVLITGETGVGKEVFAKQLHALSARRRGPFVAVNCAALPDSLIEAELFGYEEGAFTGARKNGSPGRIREAEGGVLLLDEIGDMPLTLQTRLLRVLEERAVTPLGGGKSVPVDFALVCATHRNLAHLVAEGQFRSDLLYRVNGFEILLQPLRDQIDKRLLFMRVFAELGAESHALTLGEDVIACFEQYTWPGNMRELASVLRTMIALADNGQMLQLEHVPEHIRASAPQAVGAGAAIVPSGEMRGANSAMLADIEQNAIENALQRTNGNVALAARQLGMHRSTIYRHQARKSS